MKKFTFLLIFLISFLKLNAQGNIYELGDTGPAGGIIFYDKGDWTDDWRYLEVWTSDESSRMFGCHFDKTTSNVIGGGYLNSKAMVDYCNEYNRSFYMKSHGGKRGWHIANESESIELYNFKSNYTDIDLNLQSDWYWTSHDNSPLYAYSRNIHYGNGNRSNENSMSVHRIRLIRQVSLDDVQERTNKSLDLDGNTFFTINTTSTSHAINTGYLRSIGFWVYPKESGVIMAMYENHNPTDSDFLISYDGTDNQIDFVGDGQTVNGINTASFGDVQENQWSHVYMVVNNNNENLDDHTEDNIGTLYAWVNGVRQTFTQNSSNKIEVSISQNSAYKPIYVGGFQNAVSDFQGYIDDLAIWGQIGTDRGMSESEVNSIYSYPPIEQQNRLNTGFDFNTNDSTTIFTLNPTVDDTNLIGSQSFTLNSEVPYNYDYKPLNLGFDYSDFTYNELIEVRENIDESLLVSSINVFDPNSDSSEITLALDDSWGDIADFNLVGNNLYFNNAPEGLASQTLSIKVIATDAQSNSFEKILKITVTESQFNLETKSPAAFSNNIALSSNIELEFDSSTKSSTITSSNIIVRGSNSGLISGSFSGDGTSTVVFDPTDDFVHGEIITVTLTSSVLDSSENSLNNPQSFSFTTKSNLSSFTPSFNASEITNTADNVQSVFVADLDGDGDNDLISASYDDNTIAWHENDGSSDPVFTSSDISTNAVGAWSVFAADMDNDGDMDIISASYDDDTISWYENDGASNPSFTTRQITNIADGVWSIFAADIDSDGDMDLISASRFDDTIAWYANDGLADPLFTRIEIDFTNMDAPTSVYAADMDGDGDTDIVSASRTDDKIVWFENDGAFDPTFSLTVIATSADNPRNIYLADMDNDGDMDIVSASANDDTIAWYENNGASDPTFTASDIATDADLVNGVFVADLNNDGFLDIVSASENDNTIAWYENDGNANPTFTATDITTSVNGARSIFAADLDGDGDTDLVSGSTTDDTIYWYENNGSNSPKASDVSAATVKNNDATIHLVASDADYESLIYSIVSNPSNGTVTLNNDIVTYTPTTDYTGTDTFTYKANDGYTDSSVKTVTVKVIHGYKTTQTQIGADIDGEAASDYSGYSVSFNEDGTTVAIGAYGNDGTASNAGHVRVYSWSGSAWTQLGDDIDGEAADDMSGVSVSLSSDGTTVAIGAYGNDGTASNAGHVRVYSWSGSAWTQLGDDIDGEAANDMSGISVSLSSDGKTVAIGAYGNDGTASGAGHVRVYSWSGSAWTQLGDDIDGEAVDDMSGYSVSLSSDGTTVAIGAYNNDGTASNAGHVRVYSWSGSAWTQLGDDIDGEAADDSSGISVSLSSDGKTVAIGAYGNDGTASGAGHVRVYSWSGSAWTQLGDDIDGEAAVDSSGVSVSLSSDGTTVAIGAYNNDGTASNAGHVRVYSWSGSAWTQLGDDIDGEAASDSSGISVSLSSDGTTVAIGAYENDGTASSAGHVRVYNLVNLTKPTVAITSSETSDGSTTNNSKLSLTFTTSESTSNFSEDDITYSGGSLTDFTAESATVYTATFTPSGLGDTTIDVAANTFTDSSGNDNDAATQFNWTYAVPSVSSIELDNTSIDENAGVAVLTATIGAAQLEDVIIPLAVSGTASEGIDYLTSFSSKGSSVIAGGNGTGNGLNKTYSPKGVFVDTNENVFVVEDDNHRVTKWEPGAVEGIIVAGAESGAGSENNMLNSPYGVFVDSDDNIYVSDQANNRVMKWDSGASSGTLVAGGNGTGSSLNQTYGPTGIYVDSSNNIYISESFNHRVTKWEPGANEGIVVAGGNGNGSSLNALSNPQGIYVDSQGNIYIAEQGNARITKWEPDATEGIVVAGGNGIGNGLDKVGNPRDVHLDSNGDFIISQWIPHRILKWNVNSSTGELVSGGNDSGNDLEEFNNIHGIYIDSKNNVYVADTDNNRVKKIQLSPQITISAGSTTGTFTMTGIDDSLDDNNESIIITPSSSILNGTNAFTDAITTTIIDNSNKPTVAITSSETSDGSTTNNSKLSLTFTTSESTSNFSEDDITYSGGSLTDFTAESATVYTATFTPSGLGDTTIDVAANTFTDSSGNDNDAATQFNWTYAVPSVSSIELDNTSIDENAGVAVLTATIGAAQLEDVIIPLAVSGTAIIDTDYSTNNVFAAEVVAGGNGRGSGLNQVSLPEHIHVDSENNIYISDRENHRVVKWEPGATEGVIVAAGNGNGSALNQLSNPSGIHVDSSGNIFISDFFNHRVVKWELDATEGVVVAGGNGSGSALNQLNNPAGIYIDSSGNLYIAEYSNHRVTKWEPGATEGIIVAGGNGSGSDLNQLDSIQDISVDDLGNIYIADYDNNRVVKWEPNAIVGVECFTTETRPLTITVDSLGYLYMSIENNHALKRFVLSNGSYVSSIIMGTEDSEGSSLNELTDPRGTFIDTFGNIYLSDQYNDRILKLDTSSEITISAGSKTGTFTMTGTDDSLDDNNESIIITPSSSILNGTNAFTDAITTTIIDNNIPIAISQTDVAATEQTSVTLTLAGTDLDDDTLTYIISTLPANGILSDVDGTLFISENLPITSTMNDVVYISSSDTATSDSFTFKVNDGVVDSEAVTVSLVITAINDVPVATAQTDVAATEQTEVTISLVGVDAESDEITYIVSTLPTNGILSDNGTVITADDIPKTTTSNDVVYVSASDTATSDSFTFKVDDGNNENEQDSFQVKKTATAGGASTARIYFTISFGDGEGFIDFEYSDNKWSQQYNSSAAEWEDAGYSNERNELITQILSTVPNDVTPENYPDNLYSQFISSFSAGDMYYIYENYADISIAITAVNDVPVATAQTDVEATEQTEITITLAGTDLDNDDLTYIVSSLPTNGTLTDNGTVVILDDLPKTTTNANLVYVSTSDTATSDSFTFKVNDGTVDSEAATISLAITAVNDIPVATAQTDIAATEQTLVTIALAGTDAESDTITFIVSTLPTNGTLSDDGTVITADDLPLTLSNASGEVTYISTSDTAASDSFTFKVNDGSEDSEAATIGIAIATVNDVPVASAQTDVAATEQTALTLTLAGADLDNDTLSYVIQTLPTNGTLSDNGTVITADDLPKTTTSTDLIYVSTSDTATSDSFTFIVNDGTVDSEAATISLAITAVNDVPVATAQTDVAATEQTEGDY
jgi:hypothetical protein